jgi:sulfide dehydrogenase cytochrome subunit
MNKIIRKCPHIPSLIAVACFLSSGPLGAEDQTVNRLLASQCAQCHGTNGYAQGDIDELAGEEAKDLFEDLQDMKGEDRPEDIMDHQALGYSDSQIRRIASYFAGLPEDASGAGQERDEDEKDEDEDEHEREKREQDDDD